MAYFYGVDYTGTRDTSLLTNFNISKRNIYEEAIATYKNNGGKLNIYIEEDAYWSNGHLDKSMNSLHTSDKHTCHGEFWRVYDEVVKTK